MAASGAPASKLKLLCLHGYMQNAEVFRSRVGSLRKALKSRVEFVFLDAPYEAQGLPDDDPESVGGVSGGRSWWRWTDTGPAGRPSRAAEYTGWEAARDSLVAALREHRPDGLLGFSQGATAAALLLAHLAEGGGAGADGDAPLAPLTCAVLVAGFLPRDPAAAAAVAGGGGRSAVPLLLVSGSGDGLVPPERTRALAACFPPAAVSTYTHAGAHLVPTCSGAFKEAMCAFLDAAAGGGPVAPRHVAPPASPPGALSASQSAASLASADAAGSGADAQ